MKVYEEYIVYKAFTPNFKIIFFTFDNYKPKPLFYYLNYILTLNRLLFSHDLKNLLNLNPHV